MPPFQRIVIIYNPKSTGPGKRNAENLKRRLNQKQPQLPVEIISTQYAGHAEKLAFDLCFSQDKTLIVSASGDGGYHEVINGVLRAGKGPKSKAVCMVLASGNANDHARATQARPLHKLILGAVPKSIDVLQVTIKVPWRLKKLRYAHSYVGLGLTPAIGDAINKKRTNAINEVGIVASTIYKFKPFEMEVDGKRDSYYSVVLSNVRSMAKLFKTSPKSDLQDGLFEVSIFPVTPKRKLIANITKTAMARLPAVSISKYKFKAVQPMSIQLDGEIISIPTRTVVEVKSLKQALLTLEG